MNKDVVIFIRKLISFLISILTVGTEKRVLNQISSIHSYNSLFFFLTIKSEKINKSRWDVNDVQTRVGCHAALSDNFSLKF